MPRTVAAAYGYLAEGEFTSTWGADAEVHSSKALAQLILESLQ